jgi:surfactin synthase thioesterase subunit
LTDGEFHVHVLPGSHFFINSEYPQIIEAVAEYLSGRK